MTMLACGPTAPAETDGPPPPQDTGQVSTRVLDAESVCVVLVATFESCESTTTTGTAKESACEQDFADCTAADFEILYGVADCVAADCGDESCYDAFSELSAACLGVGGT